MNDAKKVTYGNYMAYLEETMRTLAVSSIKTGRDHEKYAKVAKALKDKDPFVSYRASKAAIALMQDQSIYH